MFISSIFTTFELIIKYHPSPNSLFPTMTTSSKIIAQNSPIHGKGIFATQAIKKNELVHLMVGKEISTLKCVFLIMTKQLHIDMPFQVTKNSYFILDSFSELMNHTCDPNCAIRGKNEVVARRDIEIGEEITFDYATTVLPSWATSIWKMSCGCGKPQCRKEIGNANTIGEAQLRDYLSNNHTQTFIRDYMLKHRPELFKP